MSGLISEDAVDMSSSGERELNSRGLDDIDQRRPRFWGRREGLEGVLRPLRQARCMWGT